MVKYEKCVSEINVSTQILNVNASNACTKEPHSNDIKEIGHRIAKNETTEPTNANDNKKIDTPINSSETTFLNADGIKEDIQPNLMSNNTIKYNSDIKQTETLNANDIKKPKSPNVNEIEMKKNPQSSSKDTATPSADGSKQKIRLYINLVTQMCKVPNPDCIGNRNTKMLKRPFGFGEELVDKVKKIQCFNYTLRTLEIPVVNLDDVPDIGSNPLYDELRRAMELLNTECRASNMYFYRSNNLKVVNKYQCIYYNEDTKETSKGITTTTAYELRVVDDDGKGRQSICEVRHENCNNTVIVNLCKVKDWLYRKTPNVNAINKRRGKKAICFEDGCDPEREVIIEKLSLIHPKPLPCRLKKIAFNMIDAYIKTSALKFFGFNDISMFGTNLVTRIHRIDNTLDLVNELIIANNILSCYYVRIYPTTHSVEPIEFEHNVHQGKLGIYNQYTILLQNISQLYIEAIQNQIAFLGEQWTHIYDIEIDINSNDSTNSSQIIKCGIILEHLYLNETSSETILNIIPLEEE